MKVRYHLRILMSLTLIAVGCDIYKPQKSYRIAVPKKDYFYHYVSSHIKPFLEHNGYNIEIIEAENALDANRLVARREADLTFINNHSVTITNKIGEETGRLRTLLPLTTRLFFAFSKNKLGDSATAKELFEGKKIGIEVLHGEAHGNLEAFFRKAQIRNVTISTNDDNPDVLVFWGTFYGERATKLLSEGWYPFSFKQNWIEFQSLNDPAL